MKCLILFIFLLVFNIAFPQKRIYLDPSQEDGISFKSNKRIIHYDNGGYPSAIPNTTSYFDYQTNGANLSNFWCFGDTIIYCYTGTAQHDPEGDVTRSAYYLVSFNNGASWSAPIPLTNIPQRSSYAEIHPYIFSGIRSIALSGRLYSGDNSRGGAWQEAFLGEGAFSSSFVPLNGRDYFGHFLNGTFVGGAYNIPDNTGSVDTLFFTKYNANSNQFSSTRFKLADPSLGQISDNVRYRLTADATGNNLFVSWYHVFGNTTWAYRSRTSTNSGTSWSAVNIIFQNSVMGGDTVSPWISSDNLFKPGTNIPYFVCSTLQPEEDLAVISSQGCKIVIWSPAVNDGVPKAIAGKHNIPFVADQNQLFSLGEFGLQVGVSPLSHPTIAFNSSGTKLVCVFSAMQPGDTVDGYNMNDIWMTASIDNGNTWAAPKNITNTPQWDELYPSLSETGNIGDNFRLKFQATQGPGSQSFSDGAPVYPVYHAFRSITVGVNNISSEIPQEFKLYQNYPNPFNPSTKIRFDVQKAGNISLSLYDISGKLVSTLINSSHFSAGSYEYEYNASAFNSGLYFCVIQSDAGFRQSIKMILTK